MYALVDCNNFYASCERVFQPEFNGKPVVILSNNDGCVVARSNGGVLHEICRLTGVHRRHARHHRSGSVRVLVGSGTAGRAEVIQHAVRVERRRDPMGRSEGRGQLGGGALAPVVR